jgi:hypothetical protein
MYRSGVKELSEKLGNDRGGVKRQARLPVGQKALPSQGSKLEGASKNTKHVVLHSLKLAHSVLYLEKGKNALGRRTEMTSMCILKVCFANLNLNFPDSRQKGAK